MTTNEKMYRFTRKNCNEDYGNRNDFLYVPIYSQATNEIGAIINVNNVLDVKLLANKDIRTADESDIADFGALTIALRNKNSKVHQTHTLTSYPLSEAVVEFVKKNNEVKNLEKIVKKAIGSLK